MRLGAGEHLPEGWNTKAAWVQVGNALHCRSEILVIEAPPRPGLWHQVRHLLRSAFAGRDKTAKNRAFGKVPAMR
ncbi:MAG: hypothetical protein A3E23_01295 [Burkholderiales bacterium RIFCSPHIGHO2_12_FULL_65_48]|nr:MAG: hypothetical protein A3C40_08155 [Burkholderiales bacterium RIFCSPHIGHO2_02_FULL_64_19]OGB17243.1 MAG: hypothetical protein A3E23_01295 [Burkholderiales bacterium RIFCSPHIGHO2_12_FULL_65_48]OGB58181.1 MAG: hypothetical protein A3F71_18215 [Burkholderiales bacterium RIFCSPLOWO2_12_FULL_64_33]